MCSGAKSKRESIFVVAVEVINIYLGIRYLVV
jgi:hypothetical protein